MRTSLRLRGVLFAISLLCVLFPTFARAAWLCGWTYRKPITVTEQAALNLTNYQVRIDVSYEAGMDINFADLRFTLSDDTTEIDYWIEQYTASTSAIAWVELPSLPASSVQTIYMYYGNAAVTTTSNGPATFVFFDDFTAWAGWNNYGSGSVVQDAGTFGFPVLRKQSNNDPNGGWKSMGTSISDFRLIARDHRRNEVDGGTWNRYGVEDNLFNGYTIRRLADVVGIGSFGVERRTGGVGGSSVLTTLNQPYDNWYITELTRYGSGANNITATLYNNNHALIGSMSGTDATYSSFTLVTMRGGWYYYIDWIAVGNYVSNEPVYSVGLEEPGGCHSVSGTVFEDLVGDALAGLQLPGDVGNPATPGATVRLYRDGGDGLANGTDDVLIASTVTDIAGSYTFSGLWAASYWIVLDSKTVSPNTGLGGGFVQGDVWAEQTYGAGGTLCDDPDGLSGFIVLPISGPCYGGRNGSTSDNAANLGTAEHVTRVTVTTSDRGAVDFGMSFNVVTHVRDGDDDLGANRSVQGSLRQLLQNANAVAGPNAMRFVPVASTTTSGSGGDWWTAVLTSALPPITDGATTLNGIARSYVDGTTVRDLNPGTAGHSGQSVGTGVDGIEGTGDELTLPQYQRPELEINGGGFGDVLQVAGNNIIVQSLAILGAPDNCGMLVTGGTSSWIILNFIGTRADGTDPGAGLRLTTGVDVTGGTASVIANLVAHIRSSGIMLQNTSLTGWNDIYDIGFDFPLGDGVSVEGSSGQAITIRANRVETVTAYGLESWQAPGPYTFEHNTVLNTGIVGAQGETGGIRVFGTGNQIRYNVITGAVGAGIVVPRGTAGASADNTISKNATYGNGSISIDLDQTTLVGNPNGDGVTPNDGVWVIGEQNDGFDYPVFTLVTLAGPVLHVEGYVGTAASPLAGTHTVEVFKADDDGNNNGEIEAGDGQSVPHGEGRYYIGSFTTNADGTFTADLTVPAAVSLSDGDPVTATATDSNGNTSEFGVTDPVTRLSPDIVMAKSVDTYSDPFSGGVNPKAIPGAEVDCTIAAFNQGNGPTDNDTVVLTDSIPANTELYVDDLTVAGSGPVEFTDGTTASGLTYTFIALDSVLDDIIFYDSSGEYFPSPDPDGYDSAVVSFEIKLKGQFNAASGGNNPSFSIRFRLRIK
ncbi:MAG: DUF2341 domain-containing protein [Candidatus Eisenbacteria bacterium]